jgi:RNA-binding protein
MAQTRADSIQLGRDGASDALVARLAALLSDHELVKLRFLDHKAERDALAKSLAERTDSEVVRLIGNTAIFWKRNPDPKKRKVEID